MGSDWQQFDRTLTRARAGDREALGELFESYRSYLTLLARVQIGRQVQSKVGPSDVVQETFVKAVGQFDKFRGRQIDEFAGWLRAILATTLIDRVHRTLHRQQRDPKLERQLHASIDESSACLCHRLIATEETPSETAMRHEDSLRYADILESLPADYRQVIVHRHFDGLSLEQIAVRIGRSPDAVQKLWVRALARFRAHWGRES